MQDEAAGLTNHRNRFLEKKKVVIVDDSRTIRNWLRVVLDQEPRLEVVGEADCAETARKVIKQTNPDVVTLDIEMPGMNGLAFLDKLMKLRPMPVVMISGTTRSNSDATITALTLGAIDCILKPNAPSDQSARRDIARRVFAAACSTVQVNPPTQRTRPQGAAAKLNHKMPLILIGASTGGVGALEQVLSDLHPDGPPVVIVQHMPGAFLVSFSQLLNRNLPQDIAIVRESEILEPGQIRLAPAQGRHTHIIRQGSSWSCRLQEDADNSLHCPSVDMLFRSARPYSTDIIGVILTGLGRDGAEGMLDLRQGGARTIGQDASTSVVYGMPRVSWEIGAVNTQAPLNRIGDEINKAVLAHAASVGRT